MKHAGPVQVEAAVSGKTPDVQHLGKCPDRRGALADIINAALEAITETVQKKESISIVGFGTLEVKERKARKGYNPRTQEEVEIPASYRPFFKPGSKLKEAANVKKPGKGKKEVIPADGYWKTSARLRAYLTRSNEKWYNIDINKEVSIPFN